MYECSKCGKSVEDGKVCSCFHKKNTNNMPNNFVKILISIKNFFLHPVNAIKEVVQNNSLVTGLFCMFIYILVLGITGIINTTDSSLYFKSELIKAGLVNIFNQTITLFLTIIVLFIIVKVFNCNGSFSKLIAGIGLSTSIYLIPELILPLLTKIPHLHSLGYLTPAFNYIFAILVYISFIESFDSDSNKSFWSILAAFAIAMLVSGLIGEQILIR